MWDLKFMKNTLVQRAVEQEGMNELEEYLVGPNALVVGKMMQWLLQES